MSRDETSAQLASDVAALVITGTEDLSEAISVLVGALACVTIGCTSREMAAELLTSVGRQVVDLAAQQHALATAATSTRATA